MFKCNQRAEVSRQRLQENPRNKHKCCSLLLTEDDRATFHVRCTVQKLVREENYAWYMAARCDDQNQDASGGRRSIHLNYITPTRRDKVVDEKPGLRLFICCLMQNSVNCLTIFTPVFFLRLKHCKKTKRGFLIHRISQERKETLKQILWCQKNGETRICTMNVTLFLIKDLFLKKNFYPLHFPKLIYVTSLMCVLVNSCRATIFWQTPDLTQEWWSKRCWKNYHPFFSELPYWYIIEMTVKLTQS